MGQTRETGARARLWGFEMAEHVAKAIGATLTNPGKSNEALWNNGHILIKSAHRGVPEIGATEATLGRVGSIVVSLQDADGAYTLYRVSSDWFQRGMYPSRNPKNPHLMMVRCSNVRNNGNKVGHINPGI